MGSFGRQEVSGRGEKEEEEEGEGGKREKMGREDWRIWRIRGLTSEAGDEDGKGKERRG